MDKLKINNSLNSDTQPNFIGGQAVIEGVMMRSKKLYAMAVRNPQKEIIMIKEDITQASDKYPILKLPILRGIVAFGDALVMGTKLITKSAEIAIDVDNPQESSKFEKWLEKTFGDKLNDYILYFSIFLSVIFAMLLFILLPTFIASLGGKFIEGRPVIISIVEGLLRIAILVGYMLLISRSKEIQRVFMYHGAEHKTINCYEANKELTVTNVRHHTRLHKRCGTSFLILVMLISMVVFFFVKTEVIWMRFVFKIILIPFIAGLSYEVIRWAGKSDSGIVNIISFPGLCLQKITTKEPDDDQIEVAIAAMKEVLAHENM